MPDQEPLWRTGISRVRPGEIRVRGYDLVDMVGRRSFGDVVYLLLSGDLPRGNEGRMVEACLVACAEQVDGALAAILLELDLDPRLGKAYRDIGWEHVGYDGPEPRPLP